MVANIILAIADFLVGLLGLIVFLNNPHARSNRIFFCFTVSVVLWMTANIFANLAGTPDAALFWVRATLIGGALIPYFFLVFSLNFPTRFRSLRWVEFVALLPALLFVVLSPTSLNVVSSSPHGETITPGPLYTALAVYFPIYTILALLLLRKSFNQSYGKVKEQIRYIFVGIAFSFVPGFILNGFLPLIGIGEVASVGSAVTLIFVAFVSFAMLRHQLLDIRLVVARSVAYVLLLITLASLYVGSAYAVSNIFFGTTEITLVQQVVYVSLAIVLAFTFQPLRRFFERLTDRIFYRDRYDSQEVLDIVGKVLASEIILERLLDKTLDVICQNLRVESGEFIIFDNGRVYKKAEFGPSTKKTPTRKELKKLHYPILVADDLTGGQRKQILDKYGWRASLTLRTKDQFVGCLMLGNKLSGDIYSSPDLRLLEILSNEIAVAVVNAKSYEKIAQFNITLQQKVDEATHSLRTVNRNLKALDKAKDEFISMASHQLRTPLTAVKGYLSMLDEGDAGKVTKDQQEFISYAYSSAERMVRLITDLLNVSRLSAGRFVIEAKPTDLVVVVQDEMRQLQGNAESKGLALIFKKPKKPVPRVNIDEDKTRQVIMNFIDNAIYYTEKGSVTVTLEADKQAVRLRVTDTGIGVPSEARKKLFTKFYRADNAQQVRPDGTGLGLYLAKRVIEDQGGTIIFESEEGQGSTFGFSMPLS